GSYRVGTLGGLKTNPAGELDYFRLGKTWLSAASSGTRRFSGNVSAPGCCMMRPVEQPVDSHAVIHSLSAPPRCCGIRCDDDAAFGQVSHKLQPVAVSDVVIRLGGFSRSARRDPCIEPPPHLK